MKNILIVLLCLILVLPCMIHAQTLSYNITTVVGGGEVSIVGDGLYATWAKLKYPHNIALGSNGDIYIADTNNHRIRKIFTNGTIVTIAGTGIAGFNGDGLLATSAQVDGPFGVAINSNGELYIADTDNHRIRKISTNGTISTIAGTGKAGFSGDGSIATSAQLDTPTSIAFGSNGDIYIVDSYNNRIRKISTNGNISTIAGTDIIPGYGGDGADATKARFYYPSVVASSSNGEIYIVDSYNHRIRKIFTNGTIVTIAGTGIAGFNGDGLLTTSTQLNYPSGVAISSNGDIYIVDSYNHRIRKIFTNGTISTIAGTGIAGFSGDGSLATSAQLKYPSGIAISSNDEIYIAENNNHVIRKIATSGIISTIAGTGIAENYGNNIDSQLVYSEPKYPILVNGTLVFSDGSVSRVRQVNLTTHVLTTLVDSIDNPTCNNYFNNELYVLYRINYQFRIINQKTKTNLVSNSGGVLAGYNGDDIVATNAQLSEPTSLAFSSRGELYIADNSNHRIRKISTSGIITTIAGTGKAGFSGDGSIATSAQLRNPQGIAISSNDEIYIADYGNHVIRKISTNGNITTIAGTGIAGFSGDGSLATSAKLRNPNAVAISSNGEIYIADYGNHVIRKILTNGNNSTIAGTSKYGFNGDGLLATSAQLNNPNAVVISSNGEIYISDANNHRIRKILTNGTIVTMAGTGIAGSIDGDGSLATSSQLNTPTGLTISSVGEIYFADSKNRRIRKVLTNGTLSTIAGNGTYGFVDGIVATSAQLSSPNGLTTSQNGEMYFADGSVIRKIANSGIVVTVAGFIGDGIATKAYINATTFDFSPNGDLYIAEVSTHRIRKISNGNISTIAGTGIAGFSGDGSLASSAQFNFPIGIAVRNDEIYIADTYNHRIRKISTSGIITTIAGNGIAGFSGDGSIATSAQLNSPQGIHINSYGEIYIADYGNHVIRKISTNGNISTIAGNGISGFSGDGSIATSAQLDSPNGVVVSSSGEIYISENNRIRKLDPQCSVDSIFIDGSCEYQCFERTNKNNDVCSSVGTCIGPDDFFCNSGYYGSNCQFKQDFYCYGINSTDNSVCSSHGICTAPNNCSCYNGYDGDECENFKCFNVEYTLDQVCSGRGECIAPNNCTCQDGYYGSNCELFDCYSVAKSKSSVCSGHGICSSFNNCTCYQDYYGMSCENFDCFGFSNQDERVCSSHGQCNSPNNCSCTGDYFGNYCNQFNCNGIHYMSDSVCSGNGFCLSPNNCTCHSNFGGSDCQFTYCYGILSNDHNVCNGSGICNSFNNCTCFINYGGPYCQYPKCNGTLSIDSNVCNGNGQCIGINNCSCNANYTGEYCQYPKCNGISSTNNENVCNGHGSCIGPNICDCNSDYGGIFCEKPKCGSYFKDDLLVCNSRGHCNAVENCTCTDSLLWGGNLCQYPKCNGTLSISLSSVCSGRGSCQSPNNCSCTDSSSYGGSNCEIPKCYGILPDDLNVCNGHGSCDGVDKCTCSIGYGGEQCQYPKCFNILSNDTIRVCNFGNGTCTSPDTCLCNSGLERGSCISPNTCECESKYSGSECQYTTCSEIRSDEVSVCYGNGQCIDYNTCNCTLGYGPSNNCQFPICNGYLANDTRVCNNSKGICSKPNICRPLDPICFNKSKNDSMVCNGNGKCIDWDYCECNLGFSGDECQHWECYGKNYTNLNVCNDGNGTCESVNHCVCNSGWYGNECTVPMCSGILANSTQVCNNRNGTCSKPGDCQCNTGYTGSDCSIPICYGKLSTDSNVCSGRADCIGYNKCNCDTSKYSGLECENYKCFGIPSSNTTLVCSGNGTCYGVNQCTCHYGYGSLNCDTFTCSNILATNQSVCNGHGSCYGIDKCHCNSGYFGNNCEIISCYGIPKSNSSVCGGVGECSQLDTCICESGFRGSMCELLFISSSQTILQFNNSNEYVGESFKSMLSLNISSLFAQYYMRRSVKLVISFQVNSQFSYSETLYIENGISFISFMVRTLSQTGTLKAHAQLFVDNSTIISDTIQSLNSITIQNRPTIPSRSTIIKPNTSAQTSRAVEETNADRGSNVGAIAAGVIVPIAVIGIGSGIIAASVTIVVLLKKKAASAASQEISRAQHLNVELTEGF